MSALRGPIERFDDAVCSVCARQATGLGYAPPGRSGPHRPPILWICDDADCIQVARNSYAMTQEEFTRIESLAAQEGRLAAEAYCDEIGKTDFAAMTIDQACEFARRLIGGYRVALKVKLRDEAPF